MNYRIKIVLMEYKHTETWFEPSPLLLHWETVEGHRQAIASVFSASRYGRLCVRRGDCKSFHVYFGLVDIPTENDYVRNCFQGSADYDLQQSQSFRVATI